MIPRPIRGHWRLLAVVLLALATALGLAGFADHSVGRSATGGADGHPAAFPGGGVVLTGEGGTTSSRKLPQRTVALTFDDGPDPTWTPQILAVLRREHVPATFFVVGSRVARWPGLVRQELAAGDDVGSHTFSHADIARLSSWHANLELSLSQMALLGAAGRTTALFRPPYSSTPQSVTRSELAAMTKVVRDGYLVVLSDKDSEDWRRPGVFDIVRNSLPRPDAGAVILMHDAGGDRAETVRALPQLIDILRSRGYRFTTIAGGLGLSQLAVDQPASQWTRLQGKAFLVVMAASRWLALLLTWALVPLGLLTVARTVILAALARRHVHVATSRLGTDDFLPSLTVIMPAFNEAVGIAAAVQSVAASDYPDFDVVVVDDGSSDQTSAIVTALGLSQVRLVRQDNNGKAAALNRGIAMTTKDVIVMIDADTLFEPETLRRLVQPLRDPRVGAVSGNTKVGNRRGLLGRWQHLEYVIGFNLDRRFYDLLRCMPTVPGAIGAFRRDVLVAVGGVSDDTLAEDTDLTMAINRAGYRVVYEERARAWTEAPATVGSLWRQRYRWCYGTLQAVWKHRSAVRRGDPGRRLGLVGLPYLLAFQVALPLLAPVIDVLAIYGLVFLDPWHVALWWGSFVVLQVCTGAYALWLDREPLGPLWALPLQQFVYRQLMYLVVIQSAIAAAAGVRLRWHKLERSGLPGLTLVSAHADEPG